MPEPNKSIGDAIIGEVTSFAVPFVTRLIAKMLAGGLLAIGLMPEVVQQFIASNSTTAVIVGLVSVVIGWLLSLLRWQKLGSADPKLFNRATPDSRLTDL